MSRTVNGLVLDSNGNEFSGVLTGLASYLTNDLVGYVATSASAVQSSTTGVVSVALNDLEEAQNYAVKFSSSAAPDCVVQYGNREELYARSTGEDTARDVRTGVRYPRSRIVVDGLGRRVADKHYIAPIQEQTTPDLSPGSTGF